MGQITKPFRAVVLNRDVGQGTARNQRQSDGDLSDTCFIQAVLHEFAYQPAFFQFLGLFAQTCFIHIKPLLCHSLHSFHSTPLIVD